MGKLSTFKQLKGNDNVLTPVSVVGILLPPKGAVDDGGRSDFKLIKQNGVEYSILSDSEWERVLENFVWEEVRVRGLLNLSTMTIVPQWVVPHGPTGEPQRVSDEPLSKSRDWIQKVEKTVADFVLAPAYV